MPQGLVGLDHADLTEALGPNEPAYRARQLCEAIYREQKCDFVQISNLTATLGENLAARHVIGLPAVAQLYDSLDGTRRYLLRLEDGRTVETVLMPEGARDTICISS